MMTTDQYITFGNDVVTIIKQYLEGLVTPEEAVNKIVDVTPKEAFTP